MATIGERLGPFLVRVRAEEESERLLAEIQASRREQELLLGASRAMAEAKNYRRTLKRLAELAVAASHRSSPERLGAALEGAVAARGRRDDVVFVFAQRVPPSASRR